VNIGIDLGGTSAKIALVDSRFRMVRDTTVPTGSRPSAKNLAKILAHSVCRLLGSRHVARIGVGVAGDIDFNRGVIRVSPNLGWKNIPLKQLLTKASGASVIVDNDANAAAWGIFKTQTSKSVKNLIAVTLGTGVGGGLVLNGVLHRGATGSAGELGHMIVDPTGRLCKCGLRGCLETVAGGSHLVLTARAALKDGIRSSLQSLWKKNPSMITPKAIADAANSGDRYSKALFVRAGLFLGRALGDLTYVLNPEAIVLTGGVAQAGNLILNSLKLELKKRPFQTPIRAAQISIAKNPAHVGVIGAALL
jgi:glucokinase